MWDGAEGGGLLAWWRWLGDGGGWDVPAGGWPGVASVWTRWIMRDNADNAGIMRDGYYLCGWSNLLLCERARALWGNWGKGRATPGRRELCVAGKPAAGHLVRGAEGGSLVAWWQ